MMPEKCNPSICKLEELMKRRRRLSEILLDIDMYDRHGQGTDESMNREMANTDRYREEINSLGGQIETISRELSDTDRKQWAEAHIFLLKNFIETCRKNERAYLVEISTAEEEIAGWEKVMEGRAHSVRQNTSFVRYSRELYEAFFGMDC